MAEPSDSPHRGTGAKRTVVTVMVCAAIMTTAVGLIAVIRGTEPTAQRIGATRKGAALVETIVVSNGTYRPVMVALGTVAPARDIVLSPRVSGQIVDVASTFVPGGFVSAGEILATIDPADFENLLAMRESDLREAEAQLAIEKGRRAVAEQEFALLGEEIDPSNRGLVLREPQIASARARAEAASAALTQARLDLDRTRLRAPFDAQVLLREINVGSQVSPGDELARLVGVDTYWVITTIPLRDADRIRLLQGDQPGSLVRVRHRTAWPDGVFREGHVQTLIGVVDDRTRLARVVVTVDDPMGRSTEAPSLVLGTVLETQIEGNEIADVVRLDRDLIREGPSVWLFVDGKLEIRTVSIACEDAEFAYIREGLSDGDEVVVTSLATASQGIGLKRIGNDAEDAEGGTP